MLIWSFSIMLFVGLLISYLLQKMKLPHIVGLLLAGWLLGPYATNILDPELLTLSPTLRKIALYIILIRVGLNLSLKEIKNLGSTAIFLTLLPALFEISAYTILGHYVLNLPFIEAAMLGSVIAAVSPAIIVPRMISLLHKPGNKRVPQLLMSASSLDDILVIVIFSTLLMFATSGELAIAQALLALPLSLLSGMLTGYILAVILNRAYTWISLQPYHLIIILLSVTFMLGSLEDFLSIPFSGLIAIMVFSLSLTPQIKNRTKDSFAMLWRIAEIWLFVLVGAQLNVSLLSNNFFLMVFVILFALSIRILAVFVALIKSSLNFKEKLYCAFSFLPKATVQASIGALALEAGIASGELILTMAILAILITAPLGAILMDQFQHKLLR